MSVTEKLLKVYRVDQQIGGLKDRLRAAERFLSEQERQLADITSKSESTESQLRQASAAASQAEGEVKRLDERIADVRERMNTANTSREYKALLGEVNTLKEQRAEYENKALELLEQSEKLRAQKEELSGASAERERMRGVAAGQRNEREAEIRDKLAELEGQRRELVEDVPADALGTYDALVERLGDEAMAPIEIQDRKRHEYTCGNCMMSLPVEAMSNLLGVGSLTTCVSCGCILYLDEAAKNQMLSTAKK